MRCGGPFLRLPGWHGPSAPRGLGGGLPGAIALSLSSGSLLLSSAARRPISASASNAAANPPEQASLLERFPLKSALTAGALALAGDTLAQVNERRKQKQRLKDVQVDVSSDNQEEGTKNIVQHDFVRALRMASYGFLLYGPLSQFWYQSLEKKFPGTAIRSIALKVLANQVILGPCVLLVVFGWNFMWLGKLKDLPDKYKRDFAPSLVDGWKFWIPAAVLNFGLVPLQLRVAYMSTCSIFWNYYLSSKAAKK